MARVVLVTGGARSGKSRHAQRLAEGLPGPRAYVATCPVIDEEMGERIRRHRESRDPKLWATVEAPVALAEAVRGNGHFATFLVDCVTLWVNNLMYEAEQEGRDLTEDDVAAECRSVLAAIEQADAHALLVTNEVGMGIVPENAMARRYRDLVGRCNQVIAERADEVTLVVAGQPLRLK